MTVGDRSTTSILVERAESPARLGRWQVISRALVLTSPLMAVIALASMPDAWTGSVESMARRAFPCTGATCRCAGTDTGDGVEHVHHAKCMRRTPDVASIISSVLATGKIAAFQAASRFISRSASDSNRRWTSPQRDLP
jgi:hypothetical protein